MSFAVTDVDEIPRDHEQNPFTLQMKDRQFFPRTPSPEFPYNNNNYDYNMRYNFSFYGNILPWVMFLLTFGLIFGLLYTYAEEIDFSGVKDDSSQPQKIGIVFGWTLLCMFLLSFLVWPLFLVPAVMSVVSLSQQEMRDKQNNNNITPQMKPKLI